jgi:hypothetical protein
MPGTNAGFQTFMNRELPPGVPGDWAGANIRATVLVGPWSLVAPPSGTTVGGIGWANPETGICSSYFQPNSFPGFVKRALQAQIYQFLGISTQQIAPGYMVAAHAQGDFWGLFQGGCSVGNSVYANPTTGALIAGASGAAVTVTGASGTVSGSVLTLTVAPTSGTFAVGQVISMAALPAGTYATAVSGNSIGSTITLANLDGTAIPNIGTAAAITGYGQQAVQWLAMQSVAAAASFTATLAASAGLGPFGVLTVSAVASGTIEVGQWVQSSGATPVPLTANIQILEQTSGTTGGAGDYLVSNTIAVGSGETFTTYNGQMAKISSWAPLG